MNSVDSYTLSRYLDGALEIETATKVAEYIEENPASQEEILELVKAQSLLKAYGNSVSQEPLPAEMIPGKDSFNKTSKVVRGYFPRRLLQVVVVALVLITGFFTGRMGTSVQPAHLAIFPELPISLATTVNHILENEQSGTVHSWANETGDTSATILPVKTYKDDQGQFYRLYVINFTQDGTKKKFKGIAHRLDKEDWRTDSFSTYTFNESDFI